MAEENDIPHAPPKRELYLASRSTVAAAFAFVGMKLGWLGTLIDGANLIKDNTHTDFSKPGKLKAFKQLIFKSDKANWREFYQTFKYSILITAAGGLVGGVIGWLRGDEIKDARDIARHPIQSLKLVLGISKEQPVLPVVEETARPPAPEPEKNREWVKEISQPQQTAALGR